MEKTVKSAKARIRNFIIYVLHGTVKQYQMLLSKGIQTQESNRVEYPEDLLSPTAIQALRTLILCTRRTIIILQNEYPLYKVRDPK